MTINSNDIRLCKRVHKTLSDKLISYSASTKIIGKSIRTNMANMSSEVASLTMMKRNQSELEMRHLKDDFMEFIDKLKFLQLENNT